jgi:hypothetical protein
MKNFILSIILMTSLASCNTYKKAQRDIYSGNFDQALDNMIKKYAKGNIKDKDIARWSETFNTAYAKANAQNIDEIYKAQYATESSEKYRHILANYASMQLRYDKLKPFLPIRVAGNVIPINSENYSIQLANAQSKLADALYGEAEELIKSNHKMDYRLAYEKYTEVSQLTTNYRNIQAKINKSYEKGLTHIFVRINNDSRSILPRNLHQDLTYFESNNQQYFWQKFHNQPSNLVYDYVVELNFRDISVTPELVDRNHQQYRREWTDSSEYAKDHRGNTLRDSSGRHIKIYTKKSAFCKVMTIAQKKSTIMSSEFIVFNNQGQVLSRVSPVQSNFEFKNISYKIDGDESALEHDFLKKIHCQKFIPFPSDEQMVYDCGQDLKTKFANFLASGVQGK